MKKVPLTLKFFVVIVVGLVFISALRAIAYEKRHRDKIRRFDVCITDPVTVQDTEKLTKWLEDNVGSKNYKIRIKKVAGQPDGQDEVHGALKECRAEETAAASEPSQKTTADVEPSATPQPSSTPGGGAQVTQHLRLRTEELGELGSVLEATPTPSPTPSP